MNGYVNQQVDNMATSEDEEELFDVLRANDYQPAGFVKARSAVHRDGALATPASLPCALNSLTASQLKHMTSLQASGTEPRTFGCSARRAD